jgi:hypothetical protein
VGFKSRCIHGRELLVERDDIAAAIAVFATKMYETRHNDEAHIYYLD